MISICSNWLLQALVFKEETNLGICLHNEAYLGDTDASIDAGYDRLLDLQRTNVQPPILNVNELDRTDGALWTSRYRSRYAFVGEGFVDVTICARESTCQSSNPSDHHLKDLRG
ncbi:unnamed protein product [Somion occarium]|uniref:Uncharacterized protein n=1 Tax=Somion occarium TaxID=3059160 RepID=A0ABP1CWH7_9APHY